VPIHAVVGGLHLGGATIEVRIAPTVAGLIQFQLRTAYRGAMRIGGRCALANEFGEWMVS